MTYTTPQKSHTMPLRVHDAIKIRDYAARNPEQAYTAAGARSLAKIDGRLKALCPFHPDNNPSLQITTKGKFAGRYICPACMAMGNPQATGSIIDFYMGETGADLETALHDLMNLFNLESDYPDNQAPSHRPTRQPDITSTRDKPDIGQTRPDNLPRQNNQTPVREGPLSRGQNRGGTDTVPDPQKVAPKTTWQEVSRARYEYRDYQAAPWTNEVETPEPLAILERVDYVDPDTGETKKGFAWQRPGYGPGLHGLSPVDLPLYESHILAPEIQPGVDVIITEGQKAAKALFDCAIPAMGTPGAAIVPGPKALERLKGCNVYLWPDNDNPGRAHMDKVAKAINAVDPDINIKVITWPNAPDKGDAADFVTSLTGGYPPYGQAYNDLLQAIQDLKAQAVTWTPDPDTNPDNNRGENMDKQAPSKTPVKEKTPLPPAPGNSPNRGKPGKGSKAKRKAGIERPGRNPILETRVSEIDFTDRFFDLYRQQFLSIEGKRLLVWTGKFWKVDKGDTTVTRFIHETLKYHLANPPKPQPGDPPKQTRLKEELYFRSLARYETKRGRDAIIDTIKKNWLIQVEPVDLDKYPYLLNCQNCTLDLRDPIRCKPFDPEDKLTKILPVKYDPDAMATRWKKFIREVFNDNQALIDFVQKAVGYSLTGDTREQVWFFLHGTGSNGKSVFLTVLKELWGPYAVSLKARALMADRQTDPLRAVAPLEGVRLAITTEVREGRYLDEEQIKLLTGGDTIAARRLYEEEYNFTPQAKIWVAGNNKPKTKDQSYAMWRRIRLIPFEVTFTDPGQPGPDKDPNLTNKLRAELPGILNWALEGLQRYHKEGLNPPDAVTLAVKEYMTEQNAVIPFVEDMCEVDPGQDWKVKGKDLFKAYEQWRIANAGEKITIRQFNKHLATGVEGIQKTLSHGQTVWKGIRLK